MSSSIAALALDAIAPQRIADFWCEVLGWRVLDRDDDGVITIGADFHEWPTIDVIPVPEHKKVKNRLHLDLRAEDRSTEAELQRLEALGAQHVDVGQEADVTWVVLADPEGNEFCLLSRAVHDLDESEKPVSR